MTANKALSIFLSVILGSSPATADSFFPNRLPANIPSSPQTPETLTAAHIVTDLQSKQTLSAKNINAPVEPAALTQLMTAYLVFKNLKSGNIRPEETLKIRESAWKSDGSRMFVRPGNLIRTDDLLKGMIALSANDAALTLADKLGNGSIENFVKQMNEEAQRLGMKNTVFKNPTGLSREGQVSTAKDLALYVISRMTTGGATGYFVEYAGEAVRSLTMEGRLTLCNLSIEMGARGGMIAPDDVTFAYIHDREYAPKGDDWDRAVAHWRTLRSDDVAVFDREIRFDAADIEPMITYGTNPGMGMGITQTIPTAESVPESSRASYRRSLEHKGLTAGSQLLGMPVDYVFCGSCTNGRIEDFRAFASLVKGKRKAPGVTAWLVPGSWMVDAQIRREGLDKIFTDAGFELRQPGCSACLAMNDDKIPSGKYAISTSNRNFEGRQGPGARTLLAGPLVAAAAAVTGVVTDPRSMMG